MALKYDGRQQWKTEFQNLLIAILQSDLTAMMAMVSKIALCTVVPTKSDSDVILCLQLLS